MLLKITISAILTYVLMRMIVPYFSKIAGRLGLMDIANCARKTHKAPVPITGGVTMGISILLAMSMHLNNPSILSPLTLNLLLGGILLMTTGIVDDKIDLNPFIKLTVQCCCAYFLVSGGTFLDHSLDLFYLSSIPVILKKALTVFFIVGAVNAYNLLDGIDGLAGSLFMITSAWIGGAAYYMGMMDITLLSAVIFAASFGFLEFNISGKSKIFMGDGGSLPLGFLMTGLSIALLEGGAGNSNSPVVVAGTCILLALPIFDEARVFLTRIKAGKSPFYADRSHIHHILLQITPQHKVVRHWIIGIILFLLAGGLVLVKISGLVMASGAVIICFLILWGVLSLQQNMEYHRQQLRLMEAKK